MENIALVSKDGLESFAKFHAKAIEHMASIPANYAGRPELAPSTQKSVAIIPITGMIGKEAFMEYFGGTSLDLLAMRITAMAANPNISHIILNVNSPGGYVTSVEQTAALIRQVATTKPVYAFVEGLAASAAYWLASAATAIYTHGETARVGSIGVYAATMDISKMLTDSGITVTEFVTGKYKALGSPFHEMTADEKAKMQENVDTLFTIFVDNVAANRNVSKDTVLKSADGQVFFAADAATRSLTDGPLTMMEIITMSDNQVTAETRAKEAEAKLAEATAALVAANAVIAASTAAAEAAATIVVVEKCATIYQATFGRAPTDPEKAAYAAASPEIRTVLESNLKEVATARAASAAKDGLTTDTADNGQTVGTTPQKAATNMILDGYKAITNQ